MEDYGIDKNDQNKENIGTSLMTYRINLKLKAEKKSV